MNAPATCPSTDQRDLDQLDYHSRFVAAVREGLDDYDAGRFVTTSELRAEMVSFFASLPDAEDQ